MSGNNMGHNRGRSNGRGQMQHNQPSKRARTSNTMMSGEGGHQGGMNYHHQLNGNSSQQMNIGNPSDRLMMNMNSGGSMGMNNNANMSGGGAPGGMMSNNMNNNNNVMNGMIGGPGSMNVNGGELEKYVLVPPKREGLNKRLGPPEFYPLEEGALEDVLNPTTISEGFVEPNYLEDEFGSMRSKLSILNLKDFKAKMLQNIKEVEWRKFASPKEKSSSSSSSTNSNSTSSGGKKIKFPSLTTCSKDYQEKWMKALASSEPLHRLATKVPHGFKGDALIRNLVKESVPVLRATWFIKIILLNNSQKKSETEAHNEWTNTITQFLLQEINGMIKTQKSFGKEDSDFLNAVLKIKTDISYLLRLVRWNYQEGLLNSDLFLGRLVDSFSECVRLEELVLLSSILLDYLPELCRSSKNLIRKLISCSVEKSNQIKLMTEDKDSTENAKNGTKSTKFQAYYYLLNLIRYSFIESPDSLASLDSKSLSSIINTTKPDKFPSCWTSSEWLGSEIENPLYLNSWNQNQVLVQQLHDKNQFSGEIVPTDQQLYVNIEELDSVIRYRSTNPSFSSKSNGSPLNDLFQRLLGSFTSSYSISDEKNINSSDSLLGVIFLLCEWSVTGLKEENANRIYLTSSLLRMWNESIQLKNSQTNMENNKSEDNVGINQSNSKPQLQDYLFHFLDTFSPVSQQELKLIVRFFGELIQQGLFSHDYYVRSLISKGHLEKIHSKSESIEYLTDLSSISNSQLHCYYLSSFPIFSPPSISSSQFESLSDLQHQQNQRKMALSMFLSSSFLQEQENKLNEKREILNDHFTELDQNGWKSFGFDDFFNDNNPFELWSLINFVVKLYETTEKINAHHFVFAITLTQRYGQMIYLFSILINTMRRIEKNQILPTNFLNTTSLSVYIVSLLEKYESVLLFSNATEEIIGRLLESSYSFASTSKINKELAWTLLEKINSKQLFDRFASRMNENLDENESGVQSRISSFTKESNLKSSDSFLQSLQDLMGKSMDSSSLLSSSLELTIENCLVLDLRKCEENEEGIPISWMLQLAFIQHLVASDIQATQNSLHLLIQKEILKSLPSIDVNSSSFPSKEGNETERRIFNLFQLINNLITRSVFSVEEIFTFLLDQIDSNQDNEAEKRDFIWLNLLKEMMDHYRKVCLDFPFQIEEKTEKRLFSCISTKYFQKVKKLEVEPNSSMTKITTEVCEGIIRKGAMREVSVANIMTNYCF
eukprot:TRINITY_DN7591_c0_g1_i1.p1 TRINITY_DN7591_c0_g1~~TRINITY_DN7591_c0_g1_i1.p1  ORF type:complete len:1223 (-),score=433.96 TRINITY_DN7591_c0_g1_i1:1385-5053(-)